MAEGNPLQIPVELETLLKLTPVSSVPPGMINPSGLTLPSEPEIEGDMPSIDLQDKRSDAIRLTELPSDGLPVTPVAKSSVVILTSPTGIENPPLPPKDSGVTTLPEPQAVIANPAIEAKRVSSIPMLPSGETVLPLHSVAAPLPVAASSPANAIPIDESDGRTVSAPLSAQNLGPVIVPARPTARPLPEKPPVVELPGEAGAAGIRTHPRVPAQGLPQPKDATELPTPTTTVAVIPVAAAAPQTLLQSASATVLPSQTAGTLVPPAPAISNASLPLATAVSPMPVKMDGVIAPAYKISNASLPREATDVAPIPAIRPESDKPNQPLPEKERAAEFATLGQFVLPIGSFPSDAFAGKSLTEAMDGFAGAELPQAAAEVLGDLKVRRTFIVLSRKFQGAVLEVELRDPIEALVRVSLAKVEDRWQFGGELIVPHDDQPLIFTLMFGSGKASKSLVMALDGTIELVDDLLRPIFGDEIPIPDGLDLKVTNPLLVLVKDRGANGESTTRALVGVNLETNIDFGDLPFVGEVITAQGPAQMTFTIQYASGPFSSLELDAITTLLPHPVHLVTPDGAPLNGLQLTVALQMVGKPLVLSLPMTAGDGDKPDAKPQSKALQPAAAPAADSMPADDLHWIKINRSAGPAYLDKIGIGFSDGAVQFRVNASVQMAALSFFCEGLGGGLKLAWPPETPTFNLDGLGVGLESPPISISGALIRKKIDGVDNYDGMALIKAASFNITGLGSYSTVAGSPSLFIFAILHKDLGGPAFFHVTGLAAGFGFNRAFKLPPIDQVQNFPLVRGALEDDYFKVSGAGIEDALEKLRDYIPPSGGDYWFAAGIRFSSFEMIQSFALLSISFGHEVEIGLLGLSRMSLPKGASAGNAIAYAELALRAVIKPQEGLIAVEARLTDNSYIFSKDCRLTGGFAFYAWFSGPHSGDFVITLGGYHPRFVRPAHYPVVPRLGVNWQISSRLKLTAELYFAITPSCLMAGGKLSVVYDAGAIKAWFMAYADFLLSWQPFFYMLDMGITIGVSADLGLFSINIHLSVDLHLWGPEFAGEIDVDLSVVSFSIRFGPSKRTPPPLTAQEFAVAFLPPPKPVAPAVKSKRRAQPMFRAAASPPSVLSDVLSASINSGLIRQENANSTEPLRVVNGHAFAMSVQSLIPATSFVRLAPTNGDLVKSLDLLGVRPMGHTELTSPFSIDIVNVAGAAGNIDPKRPNLRVSVINNGVPEALWGKSEREGEVPPAAPAANTITATLGIQIAFAPIHPQGALPAMQIQKFAYETFDKPIPWDRSLKPPATFSSDQIRGESIDTVMSATTTSQRSAVLAVIGRGSPFVLNAVDLTELQRQRQTYFQADPVLCRLGSVDEGID